jgi:hypothetical protein
MKCAVFLAGLAAAAAPNGYAGLDLSNPFLYMSGSELPPADEAKEDVGHSHDEFKKAEDVARIATAEVQETMQELAAHGRSKSALRKEAKVASMLAKASKHLDSGSSFLTKAKDADATAVDIEDTHLEEDAKNAVQTLQELATEEKTRSAEAAPATPSSPHRHSRYH